MTHQEIENGNALIARFMEYPTKLTAKNFTGKTNYHDSWDWLIPVVDKITSMDAYYNYIDETRGQFSNDELINTKFISVTYERVIAFIQWHNQNTK